MKTWADVDEYDARGDREYDEAVQRLADAELEGELAGMRGDTADSCPYFGFEAEHAAWHRGRLRAIIHHCSKEKLK